MARLRTERSPWAEAKVVVCPVAPKQCFANSLPMDPSKAKQKALLPFVYKGSRAFLIRGDGGI
jgi:hypothetical protein